MVYCKSVGGELRESNSRPLAPEARIIPLDQTPYMHIRGQKYDKYTALGTIWRGGRDLPLVKRNGIHAPTQALPKLEPIDEPMTPCSRQVEPKP